MNGGESGQAEGKPIQRLFPFIQYICMVYPLYSSIILDFSNIKVNKTKQQEQQKKKQTIVSAILEYYLGGQFENVFLAWAMADTLRPVSFFSSFRVPILSKHHLLQAARFLCLILSPKCRIRFIRMGCSGIALNSMKFSQ